jgi:hypothetical protein
MSFLAAPPDKVLRCPLKELIHGSCLLIVSAPHTFMCGFAASAHQYLNWNITWWIGM